MAVSEDEAAIGAEEDAAGIEAAGVVVTGFGLGGGTAVAGEAV